MKILCCGVLASLALPVLAGTAQAEVCRQTPVSASLPASSGPLTLDGAIVRAGSSSPEVLRAGLEARAAFADADQAARPLNPSISFESENFAGSGDFRAFDAYETTLALEQTFRLGGKRKRAARAARAEALRARAECDVQRLDAQTLAGELFLELRATMDMADVAEASAELAEEFETVVAKRVDAGASAPPELARARAEAASLRAIADRARGEVEAVALALASVWGSSTVDFDLPARAMVLSGSEAPTAMTAMSDHPRIGAAEAEVAARQAATEREKAGAWPDLTVSAGVRRFEGTGDSAFLAGISLPLPVFDQNRDASRAAGIRAESAQVNSQAIEARLRAEQASLVARIRAARLSLDRLETTALPLAEEAYASAAEGYRVGKFDLTATLDARRSLIETRAAVIEARLVLETETLRLRALIGAAPFDGGVQ